MHHRPRTIALATAAVLALGLAACSGSDSAGDDPAMPTVDGAFGENPTIEFPDADPPAELEVEVLEDGDGAEVGADDFVIANYVGQVWDGEVFDTSFERGQPTGFSLNSVIEGWKEGLTGTHEGDRVLLSVPAELGYGPSGGNPQAGIGEDDTIVFVVDVVDTLAPDAAGDPEAAPEAEAPAGLTVEGQLGEPATIAVAEGTEAPTENSLTVVGRGDGPEVPDADATVYVGYAAALWDNSQSESTWDTGQPYAVPVPSGTYFDLLAGVPVGSRVVMQVAAQGESPAMAAVLDVLAVTSAE